MAATVQIISYYGDPLAKTAVTSQRFNTAVPSQRDPGLASPCNVPPDGLTYRSVWQYTGLEVTAGTYSQLTNFRIFGPKTIKTDWGLGSGKVQVALKGSSDAGIPVADLIAPTGSNGLYGYDILDEEHGIPYYAGESCADFDNYGTADPLVFDSSVITPSSPSKITKLATLQLVCEDDTQFGEKSELTCGIRWQEI